jgi:hypothetical protein
MHSNIATDALASISVTAVLRAFEVPSVISRNCETASDWVMQFLPGEIASFNFRVVESLRHYWAAGRRDLSFGGAPAGDCLGNVARNFFPAPRDDSDIH